MKAQEEFNKLQELFFNYEWNEVIKLCYEILLGAPYVAHFWLARTLEQLGENDKAIEHYKSALAHNPKFTLARANLAVKESNSPMPIRGSYAYDAETVKSDVGKAIKNRAVSDNDYVARSIIYMLEKSWKKVLADCWNALKLNSKNYDARFILINCYEIFDTKKAIAELDEFLKEWPDNALFGEKRINLCLEEVWEDENIKESLQRDKKKYITLNPLNNLDKSLKIYETLLEFNPEDDRLQLACGKVYLKHKQFVEAIKKFDQISPFNYSDINETYLVVLNAALETDSVEILDLLSRGCNGSGVLLQSYYRNKLFTGAIDKESFNALMWACTHLHLYGTETLSQLSSDRIKSIINIVATKSPETLNTFMPAFFGFLKNNDNLSEAMSNEQRTKILDIYENEKQNEYKSQYAYLAEHLIRPYYNNLSSLPLARMLDSITIFWFDVATFLVPEIFELFIQQKEVLTEAQLKDFDKSNLQSWEQARLEAKGTQKFRMQMFSSAKIPSQNKSTDTIFRFQRVLK